MNWIMKKTVTVLFFVCIFYVTLPVRAFGTIVEESLDSLPPNGVDSSAWETNEDNRETMASNPPSVMASVSAEEIRGDEKPQTFNGTLHRLLQKGDLDGAYGLISERLRAVSTEDPDFFFLNLYAGEFLIQKRNKLIQKVVYGLGTRKGILGLKAFGAEFNKDLPRHEQPNQEALRHLLTAWEHLYVVSEKDHQTAVKRLTDAFYGLVKPYISYTLFGSNSDRIINTWRPALDTACALLNRMPVGKIHLEGHTDDQGPAEDNLILSKRRAQSVKDYVVNKGVRNDLVTAGGKGESLPVASNQTYEGRAKNRRVDITLSIRFVSH
jgi:outer membrane protein OmpA-like peptidoglycan-associated protein